MVSAPVLHRLVLFFVIVGLLVSAYAAFETFDPALRSTCTVNSYVSCGAVDTSGRTTTLGIPDWSIGVAGFVILLAIDIPLIRSFNPRLLSLALLFSAVGLGASAYFAYVELFEIRALCLVCFSAYLANLGVFLPMVALFRMRRGPIEDNPDEPERISAA